MLKSLISRFSPGLAMDLGTANTLIYMPSMSKIVLNEPSVVALIDKGGTKTVNAVGHEAKKMLGRTPGNISAIRPMKDGVIADFQVTEKMLQFFINKVVPKKFFGFSPRVVVCVPCGSTQVERRAIRESVLGAGAREAYLVTEPMAAAVGADLPVDTPGGSMIIDIGGGTTEIAIVSLNGLVYAQSVRIGGDRLDESIITYIRRKFGILVGEASAERIKHLIGTALITNEKTKSLEVVGRHIAEGVPKTFKITGNDMAEALQEPIHGILEAIRVALEEAPPELSADIADRGLMLTGGGALLNNLDKLISQETGLPVYIVDDPLTCVARGGGKILSYIEQYGDPEFMTVSE
ncbi:MAG: rod shape-determining protein [Legionellales bacterium]|jgi:rod shape-determining protein MreB|nr:rod shape-determining protein [Legionellales bacterium]|tara:strand:+ start:1298 stop:2347 length:1050 start_codon:yes stop_codon:yes gene_type:complete